MGKKIIATDCAFQAYPQHPFGWDDVRLHWTDKPHRRKESRMICLMGKRSVECDLELDLQCAKDHPEMDWTEDICEHKTLLLRLEVEGLFVVLSDTCFDRVYLNEDWLTKKEADQMLRKYAEVIGFADARIKWRKSKCFAIPMTI